MDLHNDFDLVLKRIEGSVGNGYCTNKLYDAYVDNVSWDSFKQEMQYGYPAAFVQYSVGNGGELTEKRGQPPKMASYASSSRMIYLLARDIEEFEFEKKLPFVIENAGAVSNMDGYLESDGGYNFIEAKCREIYEHSSAVSPKYRKLYDRITKETYGDFRYNIKGIHENGYLNVSFTVNEKKIDHFDLKQTICHLLGIATAVITGKYADKPILLCYLVYDPTEVNVKGYFGEDVLEAHRKFVSEVDGEFIKKLFGMICDYLTSEGGFKAPPHLETVKKSFEFKLCNKTKFSKTLI